MLVNDHLMNEWVKWRADLLSCLLLRVDKTSPLGTTKQLQHIHFGYWVGPLSLSLERWADPIFPLAGAIVMSSAAGAGGLSTGRQRFSHRCGHGYWCGCRCRRRHQHRHKRSTGTSGGGAVVVVVVVVVLVLVAVVLCGLSGCV